MSALLTIRAQLKLKPWPWLIQMSVCFEYKLWGTFYPPTTSASKAMQIMAQILFHWENNPCCLPCAAVLPGSLVPGPGLLSPRALLGAAGDCWRRYWGGRTLASRGAPVGGVTPWSGVEHASSDVGRLLNNIVSVLWWKEGFSSGVGYISPYILPLVIIIVLNQFIKDIHQQYWRVQINF